LKQRDKFLYPDPQRIAMNDVHLMNLDEGDTLVVVQLVPKLGGATEQNCEEEFTERNGRKSSGGHKPEG